MKAKASEKIKIGIFTIIGILLLVGGVFVIGKKKNMFTDTFAVYGVFKNVGGLQIGNNIRFAGINVGTVQDIKIIADTVVRVDMLLQKNVKKFIKTTAIASIGSDGLMGDKLITIAPGTADGAMLGNGEQINTVNPMDYDKLITKATTILNHAGVIMDGLADVVTEIKSGRGSIGRLVYRDDLALSLEKTINTARQTMTTIDSGAHGFSENMKGLQHNILLKGYFKRKAKKAEKEQLKREQQAAIDSVKENDVPPPVIDTTRNNQ